MMGLNDPAFARYPEFVMEDAFQEKFFRTMMTLNAYAREISLWKSSDADYVALGHLNLNVDNAFFWRDGEGRRCGWTC